MSEDGLYTPEHLKNSSFDRVNLAVSTVELIELINDQQIETLFFLDKSARPLSWLFQKVWRNRHQGTLADLNIRYINPPDSSVVEWQGELFEFPDESRQVTQRDKDDARVYQFGTKICLVDDIKHSGTSLNYAKDLLESVSDDDLQINTFLYMNTWNWANFSGIRGKTAEEIHQGQRFLSKPSMDDNSVLRQEMEMLADQVSQVYPEIIEGTKIITNFLADQEITPDKLLEIFKISGKPTKGYYLEVDDAQVNRCLTDYSLAEAIGLYQLMRHGLIQLANSSRYPLDYLDAENPVLIALTNKIAAGLHLER